MDKDGVKQTADTIVLVVLGPFGILDSSGSASETENHGDIERSIETGNDRDKDLPLGGALGHVDSVVGSVGSPAGSKAIDCGAKGQNVAGSGGSANHVTVGKLMGFSHSDGKNEEDDDVGDPGPLLEHVNNVVAKEGDAEGQHCNDDDTGPGRELAVVDRVKELGRNNGIDSGPANTSNNVDDGGNDGSVSAEPESGDNHLSETKLGAKSGEESNGQGAQEVEEDDGQEGRPEIKAENCNSEDADGEGGNDHVGAEPHGRDVPYRRIGLLFFWDALDAAGFDVGKEPGVLNLGEPGLVLFFVDSAFVGRDLSRLDVDHLADGLFVIFAHVEIKEGIYGRGKYAGKQYGRERRGEKRTEERGISMVIYKAPEITRFFCQIFFRSATEGRDQTNSTEYFVL